MTMSSSRVSSSSQCIVRTFPTLFLILSLLVLVLVSSACNESGPKTTSNSSSSTEQTSAEKAAITAVQQYSTDGSNKLLDWLAVAMAAKKGKGDSIDLSNAYWAARENGERIQVRFHYKEDGKWQYAEWRYVPSTGYVAGENEMGRLVVGTSLATALPQPTIRPLEPTSTPVLTLAGTPLPTPASTPVVEIAPAGWKTYQFIGAPLIVAYPPNWAVFGEDVRELVLRHVNDPAYLMGISIFRSSPVPGTTETDVWGDYDQQVSTLKQVYLGKKVGGNGPSRFVSEGRLDTDQQQAYVVAINDTERRETFISAIPNGENAALVILIKVGGEHLPDDVVVTASQVAKYIRWIVSE
jgi:hypothetical protein